MNTKRNYYLIVPVDNIYTKTTKGKVAIVDNDTAKMIFNSYNIPREFQKMIFKVSVGGMTETVDSFELITNKMFVFKTPFIKALLNPIANSVVEMFSKEIGIVTENRLYHADSVKKFYQQIVDAKLASRYGDAVREILHVSYEKERKGLFAKIKKKK